MSQDAPAQVAAKIALHPRRDTPALRAGFVQSVSHELRTPLQQILLFSDLLRSDRLPDAGARRQALDIVHGETHRLIDLVENLLRFSGRASNQVRLRRTDLGGLVRETVEAFRPLAASRGVEIEVRVADEIVANTDPDALKRVLINLLDNAVKYGPEGQTIVLDVEMDVRECRLRVTDQGPGIAPGDLELAFAPFGRVGPGGDGPTGSGIGLSIVQEITSALGGSVHLLETASSGTSFEVRLPRGPVAP